MIRLMRYWRDGLATPVYISASAAAILAHHRRWPDRQGIIPQLTDMVRGSRYWIEDEHAPATIMQGDWRPEKL